MRVDQMEVQWNPLNRQPPTADTHNITENSQSSYCPYIHFNKQPLKSGYPATLYNQQFLSTQLNANNT